MRTLLALLPLVAGCATAPVAVPPPPPRILAIFAHPDDETVVAPALANAARRGAHVRIVYATSGDASAPETTLKPGAAIATLRTGEARCASRALGTAVPVVLDFGDGRLGEITRPPAATLQRLRDLLDTYIAQERPDIVITWGPDGGYGHPDHRLTSAVVSDALAQLRVRPLLLYAAIPAGSHDAVPEIAAMGWTDTASDLLTVKARFDEADLAAAGRAVACHASQFGPQLRETIVPTFAATIWREGVAFRPALDPARGDDLLKLAR